jgi:transcription antitermination protein NusB
MTRRTRAREVALQLLFQRDVNPTTTRPTIERFVQERLNEKEAEPFCLGLYDGVLKHLSQIDAELTSVAENWRLHRMAVVDRNVLRLGVYEMFYMPDPTPGPVALNEAIEMARRFGSLDSPGFVNGILDKLHKNKTAPPTTEELQPVEAK